MTWPLPLDEPPADTPSPRGRRTSPPSPRVRVGRAPSTRPRCVPTRTPRSTSACERKKGRAWHKPTNPTRQQRRRSRPHSTLWHATRPPGPPPHCHARSVPSFLWAVVALVAPARPRRREGAGAALLGGGGGRRARTRAPRQQHAPPTARDTKSPACVPAPSSTHPVARSRRSPSPPSSAVPLDSGRPITLRRRLSRRPPVAAATRRVQRRGSNPRWRGSI